MYRFEFQFYSRSFRTRQDYSIQRVNNLNNSLYDRNLCLFSKLTFCLAVGGSNSHNHYLLFYPYHNIIVVIELMRKSIKSKNTGIC